MNKLINTISGSLPMRAYEDSSADLWDQNIAAQYIIAYELNPGLDRKIQDMLPNVSFEIEGLTCSKIMIN